MGKPIETIITEEHALFVQRTGDHLVTLYKYIDSRPHGLALGRTGAGLDGVLDGWEPRNEWHRIGSEQWEPTALEIPVIHSLWPTRPAQAVLVYLDQYGFLPCEGDAADTESMASLIAWLAENDTDGMTYSEMFHAWAHAIEYQGHSEQYREAVQSELSAMGRGHFIHMLDHEIEKLKGPNELYRVDGGAPLQFTAATEAVLTPWQFPESGGQERPSMDRPLDRIVQEGVQIELFLGALAEIHPDALEDRARKELESAQQAMERAREALKDALEAGRERPEFPVYTDAQGREHSEY
jgi:hypothetical protein